MSMFQRICQECDDLFMTDDSCGLLCPKCVSYDPNPPTCKACGKTLHDHLGHEGQCRQLQEAKRILREVQGVFERMGVPSNASIIKTFLDKVEGKA